MPILVTLLLYFIASAFLGLALVPAVGFVHFIMGWVETTHGWPKGLMFCWSAAAAFFIFGISLIFVVGLVRTCLMWQFKEGSYPVRSVTAFKWFTVNALQTLVCNVFGGFLILTPFMNMLYRLMGARLGRDVLINSEFCADLPLLEIGDGSVIGGHATVIGHSLEGGRLILKSVKIGKNVVIGLNAVVLPGCVIGDGAVIAAGAVLTKDTVVEANNVYAGVPARLQE